MRGQRLRYISGTIGLMVSVLAVTLVLSHCGNYKFNANSQVPGSPNNTLGTPNPDDVNCNTNPFVQPQPTSATTKVDILFVVHPTASFQSVTNTVAAGLSNFIDALPPGFDYTVAVLPADTEANPAAGYLYGLSTMSSPVLTASMGAANVTSSLQQIMATLPDDGNYHNEEGMSSLYTLLDQNHLPTAQSQGFFRPGAALAVIFVANEADLCGIPTPDPLTDDDWAQEYPEGQADCNSNGNPLINPVTTFTQLQSSLNLANLNLLTIGSIIYTSMSQQPLADGTEAEYGWGYIDITNLANGPSIDINGNIPAGLAMIGQQVNTKLTLMTDFTPTETNLDPNTIVVLVNGVEVPFSYHPSTNDVHISPTAAGGAGATVTISYCQLPAGDVNANPTACSGTLCTN